MHRLGIVIVVLAALMAPSHSASVQAMSRAQAEKQCRAELDSFDGEKRRSRTGYSLAQDMAFCIKQKTGR
jgi:hypothetical protein